MHGSYGSCRKTKRKHILYLFGIVEGCLCQVLVFEKEENNESDNEREITRESQGEHVVDEDI